MDIFALFWLNSMLDLLFGKRGVGIVNMRKESGNHFNSIGLRREHDRQWCEVLLQ